MINMRHMNTVKIIQIIYDKYVKLTNQCVLNKFTQYPSTALLSITTMIDTDFTFE